MAAVTARLRRDIEQATAQGNFVRVKVMAGTRLEMMRRLEGEVAWPAEELTFLQAALDEANARLAEAGR
jgi:hypothetical protein